MQKSRCIAFWSIWYTDATRIRLFAECQMVCRVFFRARDKEALCQVPKKHLAKKHSAKRLFCRVSKNTWQKPTLGKEAICRVFFFHTRHRSLFAECFLYTRQRKFQIEFWSPKWIQIKKFSTTKLYNFSRSTIFILLSSFDKVKINLFTKFTCLFHSLWNYKSYI